MIIRRRVIVIIIVNSIIHLVCWSYSLSSLTSLRYSQHYQLIFYCHHYFYFHYKCYIHPKSYWWYKNDTVLTNINYKFIIVIVTVVLVNPNFIFFFFLRCHCFVILCGDVIISPTFPQGIRTGMILVTCLMTSQSISHS